MKRTLQTRTITFTKFKILEANGYSFPEANAPIEFPKDVAKRYAQLAILAGFAKIDGGMILSTGVAK